MRSEPVGTRARVNAWVGALVLVTLTFVAAPGRLLPDTKLDMALNPEGFLSRALHMWDPSGAFGQVQNQAYGYFFPMGPFYLLGDAVNLAPWITQRLWLSLVLCVAYFGVLRLARALDLGGPGAQMVAAFAYALAPRAQTLLGINSSEFWPTAVLPWILLPLVTVRSPRRAAALSALAVVVCGGINATAVFAVLLVPGIYLLFYRRRLLLWWVPLTVAASFWWLAPTYLMGRYVFPFLPYTETATTTTSVTSLPNALRGVSQWSGYLPGAFSPWWPAGNQLAGVWWLILATGVVAGLGVMGIRRSQHRVFLASTLLLGLAIVVAGHTGTLFAGEVRDLLDGALAPLRNLHKFDALIRLPLALGLAALSVKVPWRRVAAVAVAVCALPAVGPGFGIKEAPVNVPGYMRDAAAWLNERDGTVLSVPGQQFAQYTYGRMMDDPLQSLLDGRWAGRMVTPSGSVGLARLLQTFDERFATGQGSPGMAQVLARMGVRYLFVRNDVERGVLGGAWPARVHDAIEAMPGVRLAASFGRTQGMRYGSATASFDQRYPAVQIYEVPSAAPRATVVEAEPLRVSGGPEALLALADEGMLDDGRPVVLNDGSADVSSDTLRRRELSFSDLRGGVSPTMTADQEYVGNAPTKDFTQPGWEDAVSVARYSGIKDVTASSSASDAAAALGAGLMSQHPFAALDGDPGTQWTSAGWGGAIGEWLEVEFDRPIEPKSVNVAFGVSDLLGPSVSKVTVETDAGRLTQDVRKTRKAQRFTVPEGVTSKLRIKIAGLRTKHSFTIGTRAAITELTVPGVTPQRSIVLPDDGSALLFTGLNGYAPGCMRGSEAWVCSNYLAAQGEEGRAFVRTFTHAGGPTRLTGSAIVSHPGLIAEYTGADGVRASSSLVDDAPAQPRSAYDGDPATTWIAALSDDDPTLTREFAEPVTLSELRFTFPARRGVTRVTVTGDDGEAQEAFISTRGIVKFAPIRTRTLTLEFPGSTGIQISEITAKAMQPLPAEGKVPDSCGTGPSFTVDGSRVQTRLVDASYADILSGRAVRFASCTAIPLNSGEQTLTLDTGSFLVATAALRPTSQPPAHSTVTAADVTRWDATTRAAEVRTSSPAYLTVPENFNAGWTATLNGQTLTPVVLDGWRQAWRLPAHTSGTVTLTYTPDHLYRLFLFTGLALVLLVILAAALPGRPAPLPTPPKDRDLRWAAAPFALWTAGPLGLTTALLTAWTTRRRTPPPSLTPLLAFLPVASTVLAAYLYRHGLAPLYTPLTQHLPAALYPALATLLLTPSPTNHPQANDPAPSHKPDNAQPNILRERADQEGRR
ncbi:alpha-(1-_3)-arabinofuranosyltransferase family protein [Actinocorallia sp. A-T 12471]|uniref:alpha-(1->3)-arabinofuranosyltransferase domain-containing protein n=1 Tax=Actinocorallia sp. A-T 12471 TaxID=3089813 RepID=UPI0029D0AD71|nr:alpha-(1->3)-arabinofuranosyltransferase family protein [Actinocorallia sp. A-T 12471]MDX6743819.1 alpha-(1->3)-arabinofuranosyltransferase family protein [Actinocorallia sp. A-T 12471]